MHSLLARMSLGAAMVLAITPRGAIADAQPAPAAPAPVSERTRAMAEQLTDDAIAAERDRDYTRAIELYRQAYQLAPHPILQFNIGQAYMLAGDDPMAEKFFRRYLARDPEGPGAAAARGFLASLPAPTPGPPQAASPAPPQPAGPDRSRADGSQRAPLRYDVLPVPGPPRADGSASSGATREAKDPGRSVSAAAVHTRARGERTEAQRATEIKHNGYLLMGAGAALGATAIGFASQDHDRFAITAGLLGGASIVGGMAMYQHGVRRLHAARPVAWSPVVGPGFAGVALAGALP
jgi:tetratricopeptide (TPR) repeat protein